jgi:hypothetical protein
MWIRGGKCWGCKHYTVAARFVPTWWALRLEFTTVPECYSALGISFLCFHLDISWDRREQV